MREEIDTFKYMMAAEKLIGLLSNMDQVLDFLDEYEIKPDIEVKKALTPKLESFKKWMDDGK